MPSVFNKYRNPPKDAVYIGRGARWGNPFVIGKDGDRDDVCNQYEAYVEANPDLKAAIEAELNGKNLMCFCAPARCHGDYLLKIANAKKESD